MALGVSWHDGWNKGDAFMVFNVDQVGQEALELLACKVGVVSVSRLWGRLLMHSGW